MAKAILVMEMPNDCSECEYLRRVQNGRCCILCDIAPQIGNNRPSWCPLKPMPEKRDMRFLDDASEYYRQGWNACVDVICGKEQP